MKYSQAFSPCPNDTFLFGALATGMLRLPEVEWDIHLHYIQTLNRLALRGTYQVNKISCYVYFLAKSHYSLLNVGAARTVKGGPLLVAQATHHFLKHFAVTHIINAGVAGA